MAVIMLNAVPTDPDIEVGGYLTLERADGRSVWRQRFVCAYKAGDHYVMQACEVDHRPDKEKTDGN